jgi:hypothetical protein
MEARPWLRVVSQLEWKKWKPPRRDRFIDLDANSKPLKTMSSVGVIYNPETARAMVLETHAALLQLASDSSADWVGTSPSPDDARKNLDALIQRHEHLPSFQIAWHLAPEIDAAAMKTLADQITDILNARIKKVRISWFIHQFRQTSESFERNFSHRSMFFLTEWFKPHRFDEAICCLSNQNLTH